VFLLRECNRVRQAPAPLQRSKERAILQNFLPRRSVRRVHQDLPDCRSGGNWRGSVQQRRGDALSDDWFLGRAPCDFAVLKNNAT
jgi:hypothetical protein